MDLTFLLQLFNSTLALVVGTEIFLNNADLFSSVDKAKPYLLLWGIPNLIALVVAYLPALHVVSPVGLLRIFFAGSYFMRTLVFAILFTYAGLSVIAFAEVRMKVPIGEWERWALAGGSIFSVVFLVSLLLGWHDALEDKTFFTKILMISVTYALVCWYDTKRRRQGLKLGEFLLHFLNASTEACLMMPIIATGLATILVLTVSIVSAFHLTTEWLNWPIYYTVLYGPWAAVYVLVKRRCLRPEEYVETTRMLAQDNSGFTAELPD